MDTLYISERETAALLGHSTSWLAENREKLECEAGFPPRDPIVNKRHRPAILAWAEARTENLTKAKTARPAETKTRGNIDAF